MYCRGFWVNQLKKTNTQANKNKSRLIRLLMLRTTGNRVTGLSKL